VSNITRDSDIQHGEPCLARTRWPTETALGFNNDIAAIQLAFPHVSREQIETAIRYERSWHRRLGRRAWQVRRRLAGVLLGIPDEEMESV